VLRKRAKKLQVYAYLRRAGVEYEDLPVITGAIPRLSNAGRMRFGSGVGFIAAPGDRAHFATAPDGTIDVGDGVYCNAKVSVYAAMRVEIGAQTLLGDNVIIGDDSFHDLDESTPRTVAPIVIGTNVWVARRATILPGVTIGDHSVVAAGAVVARDVPERTLVAGVPAVPIRALQAGPGWVRK
jgi:acetyltransferase-like isoleucine patch superfamily enzyme